MRFCSRHGGDPGEGPGRRLQGRQAQPRRSDRVQHRVHPQALQDRLGDRLALYKQGKSLFCVLFDVLKMGNNLMKSLVHLTDEFCFVHTSILFFCSGVQSWRAGPWEEDPRDGEGQRSGKAAPWGCVHHRRHNQGCQWQSANLWSSKLRDTCASGENLLIFRAFLFMLDLVLTCS